MFWCDVDIIERMVIDGWYKDSISSFSGNALISCLFDFMLPYIVHKWGLFTGVAFNEQFASVYVRSHVLALEAHKSVNNVHVLESNVGRWMSRHGRIFGLIEKIEQKFFHM